MSDLIDVDLGFTSEIRAERVRRKPAKVTRDMVAPLASIEPVTIEAMKLYGEHNHIAHFSRLKYKGCPKKNNNGIGFLTPAINLVDMGRDDFVRKMYRIFKIEFNVNRFSYFTSLIKYIGWLDGKELKPIGGDYFHNDLTKMYMLQFSEWVNQGRYKKTTWNGNRSGIKFVLKALNRGADANRLPGPSNVHNSVVAYKSLNIDGELKPTVRALFRGFYGFLEHLEDGTKPKINPLWDEALFNSHASSCGWSARKITGNRSAFVYSVDSNRGDWRSQLSRIAIMLCYMLTGMNASSLQRMKRSDVSFRQIKKGNYILDATKGRANHLELDNALGFGKAGKFFIERWLIASAKISEADGSSSWLFPYVTLNGGIKNFYDVGGAPQSTVNKLLVKLGLTTINASTLRKTKVDTLMKVTEDVLLVSLSANNSVGVVASSYSSGLPVDHERTLSASMEAVHDIAKGKQIDIAVKEAKHNHHDILNEYDYKRLRNNDNPKNEVVTPLGVRCQDSTQGAAKTIAEALKKTGIDMPESEALCTDFLGCFECEHHKLVAAVDDIWLMLSFQDTLNEMKQYPAVNSLPKSRYGRLCVTIDSILARFKEADESNFAQAQEQRRLASHPLYSTLYSLNDLLAVFV